jgi:hypothetical protein
MKYFNIPPAAACVIALTSVTSFAQDQRESGETEAVNTRVATASRAGQLSQLPAGVPAERRAGGVYLVEVDLGSRTKKVLVDAHSGGILRRRDLKSGDA